MQQAGKVRASNLLSLLSELAKKEVFLSFQLGLACCNTQKDGRENMGREFFRPPTSKMNFLPSTIIVVLALMFAIYVVVTVKEPGWLLTSLKYKWPFWIVDDLNLRQEAADNGHKNTAQTDPRIYTSCSTGMTATQED